MLLARVWKSLWWYCNKKRQSYWQRVLSPSALYLKTRRPWERGCHIYQQKTRSAYHLYGKPGNFGENSNGKVHPGGNFPDKKKYLSRYYLFPVFTETTEIFCTICLDYQCQASTREKAKNLPVFWKIKDTTQSRSCFRCPKQKPVPFDGNFSLKFPYKW